MRSLFALSTKHTQNQRKKRQGIESISEVIARQCDLIFIQGFLPRRLKSVYSFKLQPPPADAFFGLIQWIILVHLVYLFSVHTIITHSSILQLCVHITLLTSRSSTLPTRSNTTLCSAYMHTNHASTLQTNVMLWLQKATQYCHNHNTIY